MTVIECSAHQAAILRNLCVIRGDCMSFEIGSTVKHIAGQDAFWKND